MTVFGAAPPERVVFKPHAIALAVLEGDDFDQLMFAVVAEALLRVRAAAFFDHPPVQIIAIALVFVNGDAIVRNARGLITLTPAGIVGR